MAKKKFGEWLLDAAMPEYMNKNNAAPTSYGESLVNSATPAPAPTPAPEPASVASTVQAPNTTPASSSGATEEAEKAYEKYLQSQYDASVSSAQKRFETDEIDAQRRYERSRADYGAQAEKLRELGVDTSGYERYLNDRAYAQMVSEIQVAKGRQADAVTAAEQNRNNLYSEYLLNKSVQEAAVLDSLFASGTLFGSEGVYDSEEKAQEKLEKAKKQYGDDTSEYKKAQDQFNEIYRIRADIDYDSPRGARIGIEAEDFEKAGEGDRVNAWNGTEKIKVKKGSILDQNSDVHKAFYNSKLKDRATETPVVFAYNKRAYVAYGGKVYTIEEGKKEYDDLIGYLTNNDVSKYY